MSARPFADPDHAPDDAALEAALGPAWSHYRALQDLTAGFGHSWGHSKGAGWIEKVARRGKALGYVIPLDGAFQVSMAIRAGERDAILADADAADFHPLVADARKYHEGYHVVLEVNDAASWDAARPFLQRIIDTR